jgi:hypothetical protein
MSTRHLVLVIGALFGSASFIFVSAGAAKDFEPGDLRVCNAKRCVAITEQDVLNALGSFYYGVKQPAGVRTPRMDAPYFQLRFRNGYVTGIVATARFDRFLSYGVNLNQFSRGKWYRVPARAAIELRDLTAVLKPLRLTLAALSKSH